ncbi:MAG: UvrD-helicase domain-containing protein, partial [Novosphingobium sp.]
DTIHAFSQWLLGAFPSEAGLIPGTRAMEDRDRVLLLRQVLAELLVRAEEDPLGDPQLLEAVSDLSLRHGSAAVETYLLRCAEAREAWFGPGGWQAPDMRTHVLRLLGLPADADTDSLAALCADAMFDVASLRRCIDANHGWGTKTGLAAVDALSEWLLGTPAQRLESFPSLRAVFLTQKGEPRAALGPTKCDPDYPDHCARIVACIELVSEMQVLLGLADRLVPALRLGRAFALAWDEAKRREGLIDFDDQIRAAAELLTSSDHSQWIGYKLDRRFDHILVDEAQDTNAAQWRIIRALTQEFFSGLGQRGDLLRTLFVVGDYKQAIFRFQGTSPENFEAARQLVESEMAGAVENARGLRSVHQPRPLRTLGLDRSFRSSQPLLEFVDQAIASIGYERFGLPGPPKPHIGEARPGYVALWRPIGEAADDDGAEDPEEGEEGWLSRPDRQLAERIARQVRHWLDAGYPLMKGRKPGEPARRAGPGDVMVLVRKRRELAGLIVARLHAAGVPVAGVDRMRLGAPLAVRDLVAALRFAAQPFDELTLACLLTSPLIGWSQEDLLRWGYRERGVNLWAHMRASREPDVAATLERLGELLRLADFEPPQALLHWLLVGPWQGRRKLVARLGREANDPIDELLNAASAYAASAVPSLVGFLEWFDAGEGELKREAGGAGNMVRVMTVHGAKGLQAPIVILADATGDPDGGRPSPLDLPDPANPGRTIPLPPLRKEERAGRVAEEQTRAAREEEDEHWRLLYVAMTRAEEALFIGGALGLRRKEPAEKSWYAYLRRLFGPDDWVEDELWTSRLDWGQPPHALGNAPAEERRPGSEPLPVWLERAPAAEPRPNRPLAPSALGEDLSSDPPFRPAGGGEAARRGVLVHRLLERLPEIEREEREALGAGWLARNAPAMPEADRRDVLSGALAVLNDPRWAELFAPGALAEVPIAAPVGARVVAGTIDRLLVSRERIRLIDFKTARHPPASLAEVPAAILRQMAAYVLALESAYPGRAVEAALLYTAAPRLIALPAGALDPHKRALLASE